MSIGPEPPTARFTAIFPYTAKHGKIVPDGEVPMSTLPRIVRLASCAAELILISAALASCGSTPETQESPSAAPSATVVPQSSAASQITAYGFPASIDPASRYMFYLHGKIIEDVGLPAVSPDFGEYEYAAILKMLEARGFVVISEQRPKDTDADAYARKVIGQINTLLRASVPAGNISVVGASKGAFVAATVSFLLPDPSINYVLIGTCHPDMVEAWKSSGSQFHGNVLTISRRGRSRVLWLMRRLVSHLRGQGTWAARGDRPTSWDGSRHPLQAVG